MSESFKPLLHEDADEFERELLGAGVDEEPPPPGARERAMAAIGLLPGAAGAPQGPSSTSAGAPSGMLAPKWLVLATVLAGTAVIAASWGTLEMTGSAQRAEGAATNQSATEVAAASGGHAGPPSALDPLPQVAPPADERVPSSETPSAFAEAVAAPAITPNRLPDARPERTAAAAAPNARRAPDQARVDSVPRNRPDDDALARETLLVDEARRAVAGGDPTRALALLDAHDRDFSPAAFALEADVLRIEALERAGRTADADRLAQAFLARHIEGSYARRVRAVRDRIGGTSPTGLR